MPLTRRRARKARHAAACLTLASLTAGCVSACAGAQVAAAPARHAGPTAEPGKRAVPRAVPSPFAGLAGYLAHRSGFATAALYDARTGTTWVPHPGSPRTPRAS